MLDWLDGWVQWLEGCVNDIGQTTYDTIAQVEELATNITDMVAKLDTFISSATAYIWVSGIMIFILFCMSCYLISSNKKLKAQNDKILLLLEPKTEGELEHGTNDERSNKGDNSSR